VTVEKKVHKELQCLGVERKHTNPFYFPSSTGAWQKPSFSSSVSSIPYPTSPALLLLLHEIYMQT
jgi:hypothetical protein